MRHYLLVDDNLAFAENLAEIVRDAGDEVTVTTDGRQALAHAREERFDALLTDMRMPLMDGAELVHEIRSVDPGLPAVLVTAYTGDHALQSARQEGLLAALQKPVPVERLLSLLALARRDGLVAIVEDDLGLSDNLTEALRERGFSAVAAASVTETEKLSGGRPCCALADLRVPGGPSGEALKRLKARFADLPVLVISGYADDHLPAPGEEIVRKPFDTGALLAKVERLYDERGTL